MPFPAAVGLSAQPEIAARQERNAGDLREMLLVAMPVDPRVGTKFEDLRESFGGPSREGGDPAPERRQKSGDRLRFAHAPSIVVVTQDEAD